MQTPENIRIDSMIYEEPQAAFERAISSGLLSSRATDWNYCGHFMYMGTVKDATGQTHPQFKHSATRRYLNGSNHANKEIASYEQAAKL